MTELILGIDPGSRNTGFGVVAVRGDDIDHVAHGVIQLREAWSLHERLRVLHEELSLVFAKYKVGATSIEKIFYGKNIDSAFKLGHARGVCLLVAAQHNVPIEEYAARYVKKCLTGTGAADKEHVQAMVFHLLRLKAQNLAFDATDALSLAITHARVRETNARLKQLLDSSL